jgi:primosomal protein N'
MLKPQLLGSNNTVALYLDNLFFLPDFKTEEKILTILLKLKNLSHKNFYIKTTIKDHPLFEIIKTNDFESF